jgi:ubiquinone/menaquinone biosynthesis C-methylase UbiE
MNFHSIYEKHIFPHVEDLVTSRLREERKRLLASARGTLLEIGAGGGQNFRFFPDEVDLCLALEPSPTFVRKAEKKLEGAAPRIRIIRGRGEDLPLAGNSVDTALSFLVLCTVQDPGKVLREIYRVLKPGGRLIFFEHVLSCSETVARWQHWIDPLWKRIGCGCHLNRDTASEIAGSGFVYRSLDVYRSPHLGPPITSQVIEGVAVRDGHMPEQSKWLEKKCPTWKSPVNEAR